MSVLVPWALLGMLLVGIPILLHLLRRREVREESFPALRYLLAGPKLHPRRLRLRERLLLGLRIGAVLLAVLAAARWVVPFPPAELPAADVVVVVDNGPLSGAVVGGVELLESQKRLALEALAALSPRDRVWVIPTAADDAPTGFGAPAEARERVLALEAQAFARPVADARARAQAVLDLRPEAPRGVVVIRPDGRRGEPGAGPSEAGEGPPAVDVDPGIPLPENRGITRVLVNDGQPPRAGEAFGVEIRVEATDPTPAEAAADVPVRLVLNGVTVAGGRTDPQGHLRLSVPPQEEGALVGWIELDPDALRLDDRAELALELLSPPSVEVRGTPGRWVEAAVTTLQEGGRLGQRAPSSSPDPAPLPVGAGGLRSDHAQLLLPPADPVHLAAFNRHLETLGIPARLEPPVAAGAGPGPAFLPLSWILPALVEGPGAEVRRHYPLALSAEADDVRILATLPGGAPWAVEFGGPAPVRLLASPLEPDWSTVPESAVMLPLLERLLLPGPGQQEGLRRLRDPAHGVTPLGPPTGSWTRELVPGRRGREATPFLAWLLFVILCTEGWLAATSRARTRPDSETATPS